MRNGRLVALVVTVLLAVACTDDRGPSIEQLNGREFSATDVEGYPWPADLATDPPMRMAFVDGKLSLKGWCGIQFADVDIEDGTLTTGGEVQLVGVGCDGHMKDVENWQTRLYAAPMQLQLDGERLTVTATVDGATVVITLEEVEFIGAS